MKKLFATFLGVLLLMLIGMGINLNKNENTEYLRIHIRADSNDESAQAVKYLVKDRVVEFLTPYIAECDSKEMAERTLKELSLSIENVCDSVLKENGFDYTSKVKIKSEKFPTRTYQNLTLESGYYDALIIELGSGKGDNWWCVVYPPLCFTSGNGKYIYKSKIQQIISKFLSKEKV